MRALTLSLCLLATPVFAQDRAGNDTAGEWRFDHHKAFGLWDSMCDWRETDGITERRCYLRYVDVFSPRPNFAAVFTFITPEPQGYKVEFGIEPNTAYKKNGLRIDTGTTTTWQLDDINCTRITQCIWTGDAADKFIAALAAQNDDPTVLVQDFFDRYGQEQLLKWDLTPFAEALADFNTQVAERGLR